MKRKYGFTLVELLIVLAVIAALIATITPLALNAIRRARASQVAQNISTLASSLENAAYVNGVSSGLTTEGDTWFINRPNGTAIIEVTHIGRDINIGEYGIEYSIADDGAISVLIFTTADANEDAVKNILADAEFGPTDGNPTRPGNVPAGRRQVLGLTYPLDGTDFAGTFYYSFTFNVY